MAERRPILMATRAASGTFLSIAAAACLQGVYDSFENWLAARLERRLVRHLPLTGDKTFGPPFSDDLRVMTTQLAKVWTSGKVSQEPPESILSARKADFREFRELPECRGRGEAIFARSLVAAYNRESKSGRPGEFLRNLCRRVGLIAPHFQGRGERRVRPSLAVYDVLVRACVPAGELLPFDDFLERLWLRFGLIVGTRQGDCPDSTLLERHRLSTDPSFLAENAEGLIDTLASMGLARRFADNVTLVGDGHAY